MADAPRRQPTVLARAYSRSVAKGTASWLTPAFNDAEGARTPVGLDDELAAAGDFTQPIIRSPKLDYDTECAQMLAMAGHLDDALHGLDQGYKRLGMLVSLQRLAIELRLARHSIEGAIPSCLTFRKADCHNYVRVLFLYIDEHFASFMFLPLHSDQSVHP